MSELTHEPIADPALDALCTRVLGSARLSPHQRRTHLQHIGLLPSSANTLDELPTPTLPDDMGRGHMVEFEMASATRSRRHWLELGAAGALILLVVAVFAGVFRDDDNDDATRVPTAAAVAV